jgi:hypothetical protein
MADGKTKPNSRKDESMKKTITIALVLVLVLALSLAACGGGSGNSGGSSATPPATSDNSTSSPSSTTPEESQSGGNSNDKTPEFTEGEWPDNDWTTQVPKPSAGTVGKVGTMGAEDQTLYIRMDWTREDAAAYCDAIADAGKFTAEVYAYYKDSTPNTVLLEAKSSDGWEVAVSETEIRIIKP